MLAFDTGNVIQSVGIAVALALGAWNAWRQWQRDRREDERAQRQVELERRASVRVRLVPRGNAEAFELTNAGPAVARDVQLRVLGPAAETMTVWGDLPLAQLAVEGPVTVPAALSGATPMSFEVEVTWLDERPGQQAQQFTVSPP